MCMHMGYEPSALVRVGAWIRDWFVVNVHRVVHKHLAGRYRRRQCSARTPLSRETERQLLEPRRSSVEERFIVVDQRSVERPLVDENRG